MAVSEGDPARSGMVEKENFVVVRIPIIDMETGETKDLVLRSREDVEKLLRSMAQQDGEYD
jgi:hypothetical protein